MNRFLTLLLGLLIPWLACAGTYRFEQVDFPGAANTALYAINDHGQYVGAEKDSAGKHHAIWFDGNQLALLDSTGPVGAAVESWAYSINHHGDIAGAFLDAAGALHGYVRSSDGAIEILDHPGGTDTQGYGINDHGSVIGIYTDAAGNSRAFVRRHGQYASADLAGALQTYPLSINDREQIAGEDVVTAGTLGYGYVQQPGGRFTLYSAPGAAPEQTYFISINNGHTVLGGKRAMNYVLERGAVV